MPGTRPPSQAPRTWRPGWAAGISGRRRPRPPPSGRAGHCRPGQGAGCGESQLRVQNPLPQPRVCREPVGAPGLPATEGQGPPRTPVPSSRRGVSKGPSLQSRVRVQTSPTSGGAPVPGPRARSLGVFGKRKHSVHWKS